MAGLPLLFLDVDGPLLPFGDGVSRPGPTHDNPLLARLDPLHGPWLEALPCELVWATTWMSDANDLLAPLLGLPELPVVTWAAGRPFAWVDDELTDADRAWVAANHPAPALLHRVDPRHGLTDADYLELDAWLRTA